MLNRISVNGTELEYQLRGTGAGEPVVLIHWGVGATWAEPLLDQQALASRYQLLSYHRAGFAGSGRLEGPPTMAAHAAHCRQLMRELGITKAHIVGHSSSVPVALQLALDAPDAVHTLTLMEAARPAAPSDAERQFGTDVVLAALQRYRAGDKAGAVDTFFSGVFGPGYRAALDHRLLRLPPDTRATLTPARLAKSDRTSCYVPRRLSRAGARDQDRTNGSVRDRSQGKDDSMPRRSALNTRVIRVAHVEGRSRSVRRVPSHAVPYRRKRYPHPPCRIFASSICTGRPVERGPFGVPHLISTAAAAAEVAATSE